MTRLVPIDGIHLEVSDWGSGDPVVFVQTALTADELLPLATEPALEDGYRKILYHRRGYAGSSPVAGPGSIVRDAVDCRALLTALGIERAHIVGTSFSGAIALQMAADAPRSVHSLVLVEPPPVHTPSADEFRAATEDQLETRRGKGLADALDEFLTMLVGPDWRDAVERDIPGAVEQIEHDTGTFFDVDLPALLDWQFAADDARRIECPALYVGGSDSGQFFAEVRELMLSWLPHAEDIVIAGADHSLPVTHAPQLADTILAFLRRHAIR